MCQGHLLTSWPWALSRNIVVQKLLDLCILPEHIYGFVQSNAVTLTLTFQIAKIMDPGGPHDGPHVVPMNLAIRGHHHIKNWIWHNVLCRLRYLCQIKIVCHCCKYFIWLQNVQSVRFPNEGETETCRSFISVFVTPCYSKYWQRYSHFSANFNSRLQYLDLWLMILESICHWDLDICTHRSISMISVLIHKIWTSVPGPTTTFS